jgi:TRAP transporter TAXI family solute receptor
LYWFGDSRRRRIAIAGGPATSESFELATAIAKVFGEADPSVQVEVYETSGSRDDVRLIEEGRVDLATMQADIEVTSRVQGVAVLYSDAYQLIVTADSQVESFPDLAGHRVAVAPANSGQNNSFWFVADHYGLDPNTLIALPMSDDAADFAMTHGQVDAVFRVRSPGDPEIRQLIGDRSLRLVPILQASALSLKQPSLAPGYVPVGSYRGDPPVPPADLATVMVDRILVARAELDPDIVQNLTRILFEHRTKLVTETKLAGFIQPVSTSEPLSFPIHPGAQRYYDREKPGFFQRNTRILSGSLYIIAILSSFALALRGKYLRSHRVRMGDYNRSLADIADEARESASFQELQAMKDRLVDMLQIVVNDLDSERVTQEEFEHFSFMWQAVDRLVRDRQTLVTEGVPIIGKAIPRVLDSGDN